jgi:hypothetical protein
LWAHPLNAVVSLAPFLRHGLGRRGLLLAFPIMATIKMVFGEIEHLKPVAVLMGD